MAARATNNAGTGTADAAVAAIKIQQFKRQTIEAQIIGDAPLIMHKWDEKVRKELRGKHVGESPPPKNEIEDPQREYEATIYRLDDGQPGFPATAFKLAATRAASMFGMQMVAFRPMMHIHGEGSDQLVRIEGEPRMREDLVRVGGKGKGTGAPVPRWRAEFWPWSATLSVTFVATTLSPEQIVNVINAAGMVGIGEWRPEKDGTFGTFHVAAEGEV